MCARGHERRATEEASSQLSLYPASLTGPVAPGRCGPGGPLEARWIAKPVELEKGELAAVLPEERSLLKLELFRPGRGRQGQA